uniref:FLYWCH-type domain-containing protein n=1 Tax=Musca domestica TaxID=7370 RepID=A0A1I8M1Z2_MUSDO
MAFERISVVFVLKKVKQNKRFLRPTESVIFYFISVWIRFLQRTKSNCAVLHVVKLEDVKKASYDQLHVSFTRSVRGNNLLNINGKNYTLNRRIKDACYWECVKVRCKYTKCTARVITKQNRIASLRGHHNHS